MWVETVKALFEKFNWNRRLTNLVINQFFRLQGLALTNFCRGTEPGDRDFQFFCERTRTGKGSLKISGPDYGLQIT